MKRIYGILVVVGIILIMKTNTYASPVKTEKSNFEFDNQDININKLDEDLKWEHQYMFPNGSNYIITDIEKNLGNKIILLNGREFKTNINLINKNNRVFIPLYKISEVFPVKLEKVNNEDEYIIRGENGNLRFKLGSSSLNKDGRDIEIKEEIIKEDGLIYCPLRSIAENLGYEVTYHNYKNDGRDLIYFTGIIAIDEKTNRDFMSKGKAYKILSEKLKEGYDSFPENFKNLYKPDDIVIENTAKSLKKDIDEMAYIKDFSHYYVYKGPYTIYFDKYNGDIFFHTVKIAGSDLKKVNFEDEKLFEYGYMVD